MLLSLFTKKKTLIPSIFRPLISPPVINLESTDLNGASDVMQWLPHWVLWPTITWYLSGDTLHIHPMKGYKFSLHSIKHHDTARYRNTDTRHRWMDYLHINTHWFRGKGPGFPATKRITGTQKQLRKLYILSVDRTQIYGSPKPEISHLNFPASHIAVNRTDDTKF